MSFSAAEDGTFWVWDAGHGLPPVCPARLETSFRELTTADLDELAAAMGLAENGLVRERFRGHRRCFGLDVNGRLACCGWVSWRSEEVGELERSFDFPPGEAYVWDCATLPAMRQQGLYSALLNAIIHRLQAEGLARLWIGASRRNQASVAGIENAGFRHVCDLSYRRLCRLVFLRSIASPTISTRLLQRAYMILMRPHERRFGRCSLGYRR